MATITVQEKIQNRIAGRVEADGCAELMEVLMGQRGRDHTKRSDKPKHKPAVGSLVREIRHLQKAVEQNAKPADAIRALAPLVITQFSWGLALQEQIVEVFGGRAFDLENGPLASANHARFRNYFGMLSAVTGQLIVLIHHWMMIHGVDPHSSQQTRPVAVRAQRASACVRSLEEHKDKDWDEVLRIARCLQEQARRTRETEGASPDDRGKQSVKNPNAESDGKRESREKNGDPCGGRSEPR